MGAQWQTFKVSDAIEINPKEILPQGTIAKKISMDKLQPFCRDIPEYEMTEFSGGAKFRNGDTIMARITPCLENGKTAMVNILQDDEVGFGSTEFIVFRAKHGVTDPDYVYYLVSSPAVREPAIKSMVGSSGRQRVQTDVVKELRVSFPSITDQQRIAGVLKTLDDKIALNTQINNNLEQQIKALYKAYFVEGKDSSWAEVPLSKIIFFQEGPGIRNWQYVDNGVKFINIRCINNGDIDTSTANMISADEAYGKYNHFLLEPYDIVMSCSGTLGRYAIVQEKHLPLCLNTSVIRFRPIKNSFDYSFVFGYMTSEEFLNQQVMMANGSAQVNFGPTHLKKITIKEPPASLRRKFNEICLSLINQTISLREESSKLASIRDMILPKLISGELDVSCIDL